MSALSQDGEGAGEEDVDAYAQAAASPGRGVVMAPIVRKLRGAQRVAAIQADVEQLHAVAQRLKEAEERVRGAKTRFTFALTPEERAVEDASNAFRRAMSELHEVSPKRALAVAARLGLIRKAWEGFPTPRRRDAQYKGINRYPDTLSAGPLPVRDPKTQRKLKKLVESQKQAKQVQKRRERWGYT